MRNYSWRFTKNGSKLKVISNDCPSLGDHFMAAQPAFVSFVSTYRCVFLYTRYSVVVGSVRVPDGFCRRRPLEGAVLSRPWALFPQDWLPVYKLTTSLHHVSRIRSDVLMLLYL